MEYLGGRAELHGWNKLFFSVEFFSEILGGIGKNVYFCPRNTIR